MMSSTKDNKLSVVMLLGTVPPLPTGGAEKQAVKLVPYLQQEGVEITVISWGKLWHKRKGVMDGVPFYRLRSFLNIITDIPSLLLRNLGLPKGPVKIEYDDKVEKTTAVTGKVGLAMILRYQLFYLSALWFLWRRRKQFQVIHVHMVEWPGIVGAKLARVLNKKILVMDATMNGLENLLRYPGGRKKHQVLAGTCNFVALSRAIENNLRKAGVPGSKIFYIPNGIEVTDTPVRKGEWSNRVIFVGNLYQQPAKGVDILLKAWKKVIAVLPDASLTIVGDGDIQEYTRYCEQAGIGSSVIFSGKQKNVTEHLQKADLFVLPSRREGLSNALIEAMIYRMPVVATDISGSQDLVSHGVSGLLVPPADVESLAAALIHMLQHPDEARKMGEAAYASVTEKCDIRKIARKYHELYQSIVSGNAKEHIDHH